MHAPEHTFKHQDALQKLPIPRLDDTCRRYLELLEPLQTDKEHARTRAAVRAFLASPVSADLDARLRAYAAHRASYIEEFWYDSYLNYDSPVVLNLNPFFLIEDDPNPVRPSQVKRAAAITVSALRFARALRRGELPPDKVRGQPLDMHQYTKLFAAARVPTPSGCVMQSDAVSRHIVVLSRAQFYWLPVLDEHADLVLSEAELAASFASIVEDSRKTSLADVARSSFGLLTTENRRVWAGIRRNMAAAGAEGDADANANTNTDTDTDTDTNTDTHTPVGGATGASRNSEILRVIDSALFIVCLDDVDIEQLDELAVNLLCGTSHIENGVQVGTCTNRWYDKLQLIITRNAKVGINFEHTGVDGHTVLRFVSDIYTDSILRFARSINPHAPSIWGPQPPPPARAPGVPGASTAPRPARLDWNLTPDLSLALRFAETRLSDLIAQTEFAVLEFKGYGSDQIKKYGCSPDAFVQMSFQAAYYALYGRVECTYEPAMTKAFLHGRTEAIRTVSNESNLFVRKFFEDIPASEKLSLLQAACKKHSARTREASQGHGVDRHLYALFCIWQKYVAAGSNPAGDDAVDTASDDSDATQVPSEAPALSPLKETPSLELPAIFADSGWDRLNTSVLSTSNCGNPALRLFGFGPVSPNGFGLAYIIKADSLTIAACSKHRQTKRFLNTLNSYFVEIANLHRETTRPAPSALAASVHAAVDSVRHTYQGLKAEYQHSRSNSRPAPPSRFHALNSSLKVGSASDPALAKTEDADDGGPSAGSLSGSRSRSAQPKNSSAALNYLLGGYGYFDVGENDIKSRGTSPEPPAARLALGKDSGDRTLVADRRRGIEKARDNVTQLFSARDIERKLRLAEY